MHSAYAPNIISRIDRRNHLQNVFKKQSEFTLHIISPIAQNDPSLSLWLTIQHIIREKVNWNDDFFIFCEDDHQFTEHYDFELLQQFIEEGKMLDADILSGGVSWFKTGVQISENLFWVEKFSGLQFTVIFKKFYQRILDINDFTEHDAADYKISDLTDKKFVIYPFISIQKDFGYSDVTPKNNQEGRVEKLFGDTSERFELLRKIKSYYSRIPLPGNVLSREDIDPIQLLIYSVVCKSRSIIIPGIAEFANKVVYIPEDNVEGKWKALCGCVKQAIEEEEDFVIFSFDESISIANSYNKIAFVNNLIKAGEYGCELLLGNVEMFNHAVLVTNNLFWIDSFSFSSFIILFAPAFDKVLSESPSGEEADIYGYLSYITSHKLVLYPFIAEVKSYTISKPGFQERGEQLSVYQSGYQKYLKL